MSMSSTNLFTDCLKNSGIVEFASWFIIGLVIKFRNYRCDVWHLALGWQLGVVVSVVGRINEVNQHRARLVHDGDRHTRKPSLTNHLGQLSLASLRDR